EKAAMHEAMISPGFVQDLPLYRMADKIVAAMRETGDEVVLCTHHYEKSPTWVYDRTAWLDQYFPGVPVIYTRHKHMVDADCLVEDTPRNLEQFLDVDRARCGILLRRRWNESWWRL